jgi:hypothetical protein
VRRDDDVGWGAHLWAERYDSWVISTNGSGRLAFVLDTRRDVYSVSKDVIAVDNDVADGYSEATSRQRRCHSSNMPRAGTPTHQSSSQCRISFNRMMTPVGSGSCVVSFVKFASLQSAMLIISPS